MASIYGFVIKKIKTFRGREGEGCQGDIYYNGKKVGWYNDMADGGMADVYFDGDREQCSKMEALLNEAAKKYYAKYPLTGLCADLPITDGLFMDELVNVTMDEKVFKKHQKEGYFAMATYQKQGVDFKEYTLLFKRKEALDAFQKRPDVERVRVYTKDGFNLTDESPQIEEKEEALLLNNEM